MNSFVLNILSPKPAFAQWSDPTGQRAATLQDLEVVFRIILNVATELAIVAVFIMFLVGGFRYLTSGGDAKSTESAKNTLTYAVIGIAAMIGIWLLLKFIQTFTGIDVTNFNLTP
ncbi:MAG: hypothetical protein Q7S03_02070 [bacterium]|nr:hypothetical protein [bacterium]